MDPGKNYISILKELHDRLRKENVPEPEYKEEKGNFGFKISCTYKGYTACGSGSSKQNAKCNAAKEMLGMLNFLPPAKNMVNPENISLSNMNARESENISSSSVPPAITNLANAFIAKYSAVRIPTRYPPNPADLDVCFKDINFGMKSPDSPKSKTLLERHDKELPVIECFEKIMKEMNLKFCVEQAEVSPKASYKHVIFLKIDFYCMVVGGIGNNVTEAVENACRNGIDAFRLYMK